MIIEYYRVQAYTVDVSHCHVLCWQSAQESIDLSSTDERRTMTTQN